MPDKGIKGVPQLVRDGRVNQGKEGLLGLDLVMQHFVRHVDNLNQDLGRTFSLADGRHF